MKIPVRLSGQKVQRSQLSVTLWILVWGSALLVALAGPLVADFMPFREASTDAGTQSATRIPFSDSAIGPLGTDYLGRDVLNQVLSGGASLVIVPFLAAVAAECVGALVAIAAAWNGWWRGPLRAVLDVLLVVPPLALILVVVSGLGFSPAVLVLLVVVTTLPYTSRYLEAAARNIIDSGFVEAGVAAGDHRYTISYRDVLPCLARPMLTDVGVRFVAAVYLVATVSFLGGMTTDPGSNWAVMIGRNLPGILLNPWATIAPAVLIAAITVPVSLLVDRWTDRYR
ncbi:MAG: ABC transporter permease subunit [Rhodococcus sp.]|nr:ABC transporter permease subunit [Rhodococcus sp. (in: high G+C Gram-positive bacteria)]